MDTLIAMKNIVRRNQTKILVTALVVTTTAAVLMKVGLNQHNEFLKENNLFDAYHSLED